jgi:hypothetical protein
VLGTVFLRTTAARAAAGVTGGPARGRGYAVAGLSCGTVGILLSIATVILCATVE